MDNIKSRLQYIDGKLTLCSGDMNLYGDFSQLIPRLKINNLNGEMLIKAAKLKGMDHTPIAVDMTAGLGEDAFLLAGAGCNVIMFEQDEVIASLLEDAIKRGKEIVEIKDVMDRMTLIKGDSIEGVKSLDVIPDIVYLDPMFPQRQKSGLIKKKFQIIHELEKPCSNGADLLNAAISTKAKKIIVKRPQKGENLVDIKPNYTISGKAIRYDVYIY